MSDITTYRVESKVNDKYGRETHVINEATGEELPATQLDVNIVGGYAEVKIEYTDNPAILNEAGDDAIRYMLTGLFIDGDFSFIIKGETK